MSRLARMRLLIQANRRILVFFVLFVVIFVVLQRLYIHTREQTANVLTHTLNAVVASSIINAITPSEQTVVDRSVIISKGAHVDIRKGCEGFEVLLILAAAILAFPCGLKEKILGLAIGIPVIYAVNIVRIVSLYYVFRYANEMFDFMHLSVWQTVFILVVAAYFILWVRFLQARK